MSTPMPPLTPEEHRAEMERLEARYAQDVADGLCMGCGIDGDHCAVAEDYKAQVPGRCRIGLDQ